MSGHEYQQATWHGGLRRRLVLVLAMLLVPVLIITTPHVAAAANYGPSKAVEWTFDQSFRPGDNVTCEMVAYWEMDGTAAGVVGRVDCEGDWNAATDDWQLEVIWSGSDTNAEYCEATNIFGETAGTSSYGSISSDGNATTCHMTEFCWQYIAQRGFAGEAINDGCDVLDLEAMDQEDPSCAMGTPARPTFDSALHSSSTNNDYHLYSFSVAGGTGVPGDWFFYYVHAGTVDTTNVWTFTGPGQVRQFGAGQSLVDPAFSAKNFMAQPFSGTTWPQVRQTQVGKNNNYGIYPIVGIGMVHRSTLTAATGMTTSSTQSATGVLPQESVSGVTGIVGLTNPAYCSFYWGQKVATTPTNDFDEPIDPLTGGGAGSPTEPTDQPDAAPSNSSGCDFSFSDPSTWAGGGICLLVRLIGEALQLLGDILAVLGGLVADLIAGIGDLLADLLIPNPNSWGVDSLHTQWDNRGPGQIVNELAAGMDGVADGYQGAGGCGLLGSFDSSDIDADINCTTIRDQPGMAALYGIVQAGLIAVTCWGIWRVAVGSLGKGD